MTIDWSGKLHDETRVVHSGHCIEAWIGGEVVMMDADQGVCFGLDETGSFIWEQLKVPISVSVLAECCRRHFDADDGKIEADVVDLLSQLLEKRLVTICGTV